MQITQPADIKLNKPTQMEAIIGHPPGWTLRWGITVLFISMLLLIGIGWLVSYPDLVEANTVLTTENPPIRLMAGTSAKITSLNIENGEPVKKGAILGILENSAEEEDVMTLEEFVTGISENDAATYLSIQIPTELRLGEIQTDFALLSKNFKDLKYFLSQDANFLKINNLRLQISEILNLDESLNRQIDLFEQELDLHLKNVVRDSILLSQNSLSELEFEKSKVHYLMMRRQMETLLAGSAQNRLEIQQLEAKIIDLRQLQDENQTERLLALNSDIEQIKGAIEEWKQKWLFIAPISGEVAFTNAWSEQQFVNEGEEILTIVPIESAGEVIAKASLTGRNAGKVEKGMPVHIRLEGYPYQEYGQLNGKVGDIAAVPGQRGYECDILLPDGLVTSYSKTIPFRQEMKGTARIVTEERRLLIRILEKLRAAMET